MKKIIFFTFVFIIYHLTFSIYNCFSQWQADVRLTNDLDTSLTSINNAWCIASNGNFVHAVWSDTRDGNLEIYYKRSTDGGINWGTDVRLTNESNISYNHSVAVSGQYVHIVWEEYRDGNREIYYKRSTDEGITWSIDTRLTNNSSPSAQPCIASYSSNVHVVWRDDRMGNMEVFYKRSTDNGTTWSNDTLLSDYPDWSWLPSISISGQYVHVVWNDTRNPGSGELYYKLSTDGGTSWDIDTRLTNDPASSYYPSVASYGLLVNVVWNENRDGNWEIYYKRSTDGGINWGVDTRLTNDPAISYYPSIAVSGSNVHIVFQDNRNGNNEIYYKLSIDGGVSWSADTRLTNNPFESTRPSIALSNSILHIVWSDYRDGNYEIYYKQNPTGNLTGIVQTNPEIPKEYKLMQNYPNPFNPNTNIRYTLPKNSFVSLKVYDVLGKEVATLVDESLTPGTYKVTFDALGYSSGVYFYRIAIHSDKLRTDGFTDTKKMLMIK